MKKLSFLVPALILQVLTCFAQEQPNKTSLSYLLKSFDKSELEVTSYSEPIIFWDRDELISRIETAVFKDTVWAKEYFFKYKDSLNKPYHPKLGLTENEFSRLMLINSNQPRFLKSDEFTVEVVRVDGILTFHSDDEELNLLEELKIDLNSGTLNLYGQPVPDQKSVNVDKTDNVFASKWSGFKWGGFVEDETNGDEYLISVTLGQLEISKQIYLEIKSMLLDIDLDERGQVLDLLIETDKM